MTSKTPPRLPTTAPPSPRPGHAAEPTEVVTTVPTRGAFDLERLATFGSGHLPTTGWDGAWRLAFVLDDYSGHAGVVIRQVEPELLELTVHAPAHQVASAVHQATRVASCTHGAEEYSLVGQHDPVLGSVLAKAPGLRPPLFYSPYEGALWGMLSQRRSRRQATLSRQRLAQAHGATFHLAGLSVAAAPTPEQLLHVDAVSGTPPQIVPRLHALAEAALAGTLDAERLTSMEPREALKLLQTIPGVGPFTSELVLVRATGARDILAFTEPKARAAIAKLYGESEPLTDARLIEIAENWRPFRTWAMVAIRALAGEP